MSSSQLLRHLAVVDLHWVYRLKGEPVSEEHKQVYGPIFDEHGRIPMIRGISLEQLLHEYDQVQQMLEAVCMELTDADLGQILSFSNSPYGGTMFPLS